MTADVPPRVRRDRQRRREWPASGRLVALRGDRGRESALTLHSDHNDWTCLDALVPTGLLVTGEEIDIVEDVADLKERRHRSKRPVRFLRRRASRPRKDPDARRAFDRHRRR